MAHQSDFIGKKFGHLIIKNISKYVGSVLHVVAICDCKSEGRYVLENIERGKIKSCGCMNNKDSPVFIENVRNRILSLVEVDGDCWIWKGLNRRGKYNTPYVNVCNIQINPVKYFSGDGWKKPNRNAIYIRQCEKNLCVNPDHHVRVSRQNINKALKKEILCEYLKRN